LVISPDGKWLAAASRNMVTLLDAQTGKKLKLFPPPSSPWVAGKILPQAEHTVTAMVWSADSKSLAVATEDRWIRIWDIETAKVSNALQSANNIDIGLVFLTGGKQLAAVGGWRPWLAIVDGDHLKIHDLATGQKTHAFKTPSYRHGRAQFSPQGQYAAGTDMDKVLKVLRVIDGKELLSAKDQIGAGFDADGKRLVTYGKDGTVSLWSLPKAEKLSSFKVAAWKGQELTAELGEGLLAFHPSGKFLAVASTGVLEHPDGRVTIASELSLWDLTTGKQLKAPVLPNEVRPWSVPRAVSLAFTPDGRRLAAACGDMIHVWPVELP
jgi:WD40 repeat protein